MDSAGVEVGGREIVSVCSRIRGMLPGVPLLPWAIVLLTTGCADQLLLHPWTEPMDAHGATRFELPIDGGRMVEIWKARSPALAPGETPEAYVLEFTGNGTRAEEIATFVAANKWKAYKVEAWCVNYPGYGASTGPAKLASIPPTALAAYAALARESHGRPILACGNSMGTTAALYVAAHRPVAAMLLQG